MPTKLTFWQKVLSAGAGFVSGVVLIITGCKRKDLS